MAEQKKVLIVAYDPDLLGAQARALVDAGYRVEQSVSLSAALGAVGPGRIDLMVLSPDLPAGDRRRIEAEARRRNQNIKIVLLYDGEKVKDVFANSILSVEDGPGALLESTRMLLG